MGDQNGTFTKPPFDKAFYKFSLSKTHLSFLLSIFLNFFEFQAIQLPAITVCDMYYVLKVQGTQIVTVDAI